MFMHWFGIIFAAIGAASILGALALVSTVIGGLINAMITLTAGPIIDRLIDRWNARRGRQPARA